MKEKRLCFGCYGFNHVSKGCLQKRQCKIYGKCHPTALHVNKFTITGTAVGIEYAGANTSVSSSACTTTGCVTVLQTILPVKVHMKGSDKTLDTYAFYDNGSTGCFITESVKDQLNVQC